MPYLNEQDFNSPCGELNRKITELCLKYVHDQKLRYETLNDIVGALECAKQEFYRRIVSGYENKKAKDNGDIYEATIMRDFR